MRFSIVKLSKGQSAVEKTSLPNDWSYEFAEEVVRNYVQRKFVDKSMVSNLSTGQMTDRSCRNKKKHNNIWWISDLADTVYCMLFASCDSPWTKRKEEEI